MSTWPPKNSFSNQHRHEEAEEIAQLGDGVLFSLYYMDEGFLLCPTNPPGSAIYYFVSSKDEAINLMVEFRMGHMPEDYMKIEEDFSGKNPNNIFPYSMGRIGVASGHSHEPPREMP